MNMPKTSSATLINLIGAPQEGLYRHVNVVCEATGLGVIVYDRANSLLYPDTVIRLACA